ncbi:NADAR family protein [Aeoliella sp.]|uniref:NADAR family protein n=1 Tax=Aeoliella sp. TaxID=2795800 RepID=UPI003CCB7BC8
MSIEFYATGDAFGEFSNFAAFPFALDGVTWPTSEHYFQAEKFEDQEYREKIRTTASPMIAARLGRSRKVPIRSDWESVKLDVMRRAVRAKFAAHEALRELLLSTGDQLLVEAAKGDAFWGTGDDGSGQNWLGRILMEVRDELREGNE